MVPAPEVELVLLVAQGHLLLPVLEALQLLGLELLPD